MANKGSNTNGSQFFVCFAPQPQLDGKNTVFGKIIDGFDTIDKLEKVKVDSKGRATEKVIIESVTVHANPMA
jgi:peptidyl-prolyl cis-trans isomerase-like 3